MLRSKISIKSVKALFLLLLLMLVISPLLGQGRVVRRPLYTSGGFTPADLTGLMFWLEADIISASNNSTIATWPGSAGNGSNYDLNQSTTGNRPTFRTNQINGLPAVEFDGTTDWMESGTVNFSSTVFTAFVVCTHSSTSSGDVWIVDTGGNTFSEFRLDSSTQLAWRTVNTGGSTFEATKSNGALGFRIWTVIRSATSQTAYLNGVAGSPAGTAGTQRTGNNKLNVGQFGLGFQYFGGKVSEIIYCNAELSGSVIDQTEDYLGAKYNISVTH